MRLRATARARTLSQPAGRGYLSFSARKEWTRGLHAAVCEPRFSTLQQAGTRRWAAHGRRACLGFGLPERGAPPLSPPSREAGTRVRARGRGARALERSTRRHGGRERAVGRARRRAGCPARRPRRPAPRAAARARPLCRHAPQARPPPRGTAPCAPRDCAHGRRGTRQLPARGRASALGPRALAC